MDNPVKNQVNYWPIPIMVNRPRGPYDNRHSPDLSKCLTFNPTVNTGEPWGSRNSREEVVIMLSRISKKFRDFVTDESGATAIEYGLIAAGIAIVIIAAVTLAGNNLRSTFNSVATALQ